MTNITLIIIPGSGARQVSVQPGSTIADLVSNENLHGRDIIVDGAGVPATLWASTQVTSNAEIFATGSVKGNAKGSGRPANAPSGTGRPSGGGRGNNPPSSGSKK